MLFLRPSCDPLKMKTCECGCGQPTKPHPKTSAKRGWIKGEYQRYIFGHYRPPPNIPHFISPSLEGRRFGRWTVASHVPASRKCLCRCDCGRERTINRCHLVTGASSSCGCSRLKARTHGETRGDSPSPEYNSWRAMRERCNNPNHIGYARYGGRGISCDPRWDSFENFLEDMGRRPGKGFSIERTDLDGNYTPQNCVWATQRQQMRNMGRNRYIEIDGERLTLVEWEEKMGLPYKTVSYRIYRGWSEREAVLTPPLLPGQRRPKILP